MKGRGLIVAAPHSGSGKTLITLGLLRALSRSGITVASAKAGPDYIDPQFHAIASKAPCVNLDPWAMRPDYLGFLAAEAGKSKPLLIEGMMGLFDGALDGSGSVADLASLLGLPVLLVVDAARQSHSIAALVAGFRDFRRDVQIIGVVLNRVGSDRHETMLRRALAAIDMNICGVVRRQNSLFMPSRHLGLVQAEEHKDLEQFIEQAANCVERGFDLEALMRFFSPLQKNQPSPSTMLQPLGQNIAIARDEAFAFSYAHLLDGWQRQGAALSFFSPLADEAPDKNCDAVYLPGGYPEIHAGRLASNAKFINALGNCAQNGTLIYGECGGYMVLGEVLIDSEGNRHKMSGLLSLVTSFEHPKLHLGYRIAKPLPKAPMIMGARTMSGHEFHYASVIEENGEALFVVNDALGNKLANAGLRQGNVMGSFIHLIDTRGN